MKKLFLIFTFTGYIFAGLIDAIAIIVNNEPITMLDILNTSKMLNVNKKEATELLIEQKLEESEIKRLGINVDEFELEDALEKFAKDRGLTLNELKELIKQKGISWEEYKTNFKKQLLKKKLYQKIASTKISQPDEEELLKYYKDHIKEFSVPKFVDIVKYISNSKAALNAVIKNPMASIPGVQIGEERVDVSKVNPELAFLLQNTKEASFTPIIPLGDKFLLIYVKKKIKETPMEFENVKNAVLAKIMDERKKEAIKDYLAKLKVNAKIKVLRLP